MAFGWRARWTREDKVDGNTSSGIRRYLMLLPRMMTSGSRQNRSPSREVQMTSRRLRCRRARESSAVAARRARGAHLRAPDVHPRVAADEVTVVRLAVFELDELRRAQTRVSARRAAGVRRARTIGWPWAVRSSDSGSMALAATIRCHVAEARTRHVAARSVRRGDLAKWD